jgi:hypothetical protein
MGQYLPGIAGIPLGSWRVSLSRPFRFLCEYNKAMLRTRKNQFIFLIFTLLIFVFLFLAAAQAGGANSCHWAFPKWFGCVMATHENLSGGLIAASGALIAAWLAWNAVQDQINAERDRAMADRNEVEHLLAEDLPEYAEAMAAAWRLLEDLSHHSNPDKDRVQRVREATGFMASRLSRPEHIASYRAMVDVLGWDRRRRYTALSNGLEELRAFSDQNLEWENEEALMKIRNLSYDFEFCLPITSEFFDGLFRRTPKAMSLADYVDQIGGA